MSVKYINKFVSTLLTIMIVISLFSINASAVEVSTSNQDILWNEKISNNLWDKINSSEDEEKISVWIWFTDIDQEKVNLKVKQDTGLTIDNVEVNSEKAPEDLINALNDVSVNKESDSKIKLVTEKLKSYIDNTENSRKKEQKKLVIL